MADEVLNRLGISSEPSACGIGREWRKTNGKPLVVRSPIDGSTLATLRSAQAADVAARKMRGVDLVRGSAFRLPFRDGAFGAVASAFVLRNLDDLPAALRPLFARALSANPIDRPASALEFSADLDRALICDGLPT